MLNHTNKEILFGILVILGIIAGTAGCQYHDQGVVSGAPAAYLSFEGNTEGAIIMIDGQTAPAMDAGLGNRLQVDPGTHRIKVTRAGQTLVERKIFIGNGNVQVIRIPEL